jgi:hypothetical protein
MSQATLPDWLLLFIKNHPQQVQVKIDLTCIIPLFKPPPAAPPTPKVGSGDTVKLAGGHMAISFPVTMPAFGASDAAKNTFHYVETPAGQPALAEVTIDFTTSGASGSFIVQQGSAVDYWATESDGSGNTSAASVHGSIASASDTTPPAAPAAPVVGPGDTAPPAAPSLGKGKKV